MSTAANKLKERGVLNEEETRAFGEVFNSDNTEENLVQGEINLARKVLNKAKEGCDGVSTAAPPCPDDTLLEEEVDNEASELCHNAEAGEWCQGDAGQEKQAERELNAWASRQKGGQTGQRPSTGEEGQPQLRCRPRETCEKNDIKIRAKQYSKSACRPWVCNVNTESTNDVEDFVKRMRQMGREGPKKEGQTCGGGGGKANFDREEKRQLQKSRLDLRRQNNANNNAGKKKLWYLRVEGSECNSNIAENAMCTERELQRTTEECVIEGTSFQLTYCQQLGAVS